MPQQQGITNYFDVKLVQEYSVKVEQLAGPDYPSGGNYWSVASWYVAPSSDGKSFQSPHVKVSPGKTLVGVMTLTGQNGTVFSYNCSFQGIANTSLPIQNVPAYQITRCSDFPNTSKTAMAKITIQTGTRSPNIMWNATNRVTDCNQHTVVVSNSATAGEVDLYYR